MSVGIQLLMVILKVPEPHLEVLPYQLVLGKLTSHLIVWLN